MVGLPSWVAYAALFVAGVLCGAYPTHLYYQRDIAETVANTAQGLQAAESAYRAEEQRRAQALETVKDVHERELKQIREDSFASGAASVGLQNDFKSAAVTACNPGTTKGSDPTEPTAYLLADVLARLDDATEQIARAADERAAALKTCNASYEAIRNGNKQSP
jgi:hypothetical protein